MKIGNYLVYITTNPRKTVLYTGVTNDLVRRMKQHYDNRGQKKSFAGKFYCYKLLYFERYSNATMAIEREKEIKDLSREIKLALIKVSNPNFNFIKVTWTVSIIIYYYVSLNTVHSGGNQSRFKQGGWATQKNVIQEETSQGWDRKVGLCKKMSFRRKPVKV